MKLVPLINRCLTTGILSLTLVTLSESAVQSGGNLLHLACADADGKPSNNFERISRPVSIGRKFYQTVMRAYPGAQVTCELKEQWNSLQIQFGIADSNRGSGSVTLSAYLDGRRRSSSTVSPGNTNTLLINTGDAQSINLELSCNGVSNCNSWVYFTQAEFGEGTVTEAIPQLENDSNFNDIGVPQPSTSPFNLPSQPETDSNFNEIQIPQPDTNLSPSVPTLEDNSSSPQPE